MHHAAREFLGLNMDSVYGGGLQVVEATLRDAYVYVANGWINASPAQRLCWGMVSFNGAVFIGWKIHRLTPFMMNNFLHYPFLAKLKRCYSIWPTEFFHFAFNNMALASGVCLIFSCTGLFSSLVDHAYWIRIYKALTATMVKAGQARAISTSRHHNAKSRGRGRLYSLITICALSRFDHAAHLGGALFGVLYYMYGPKI
ncbi:hypothetical protein C8J57DRAFT_1344956 [Mycena rebaudengoi]|nr:hypothetical protein C8J57DRAFT_1344956 [Mycena rebaudengoi]